MEEVDKKLLELETKQRSMDRLSQKKGIEKYDDYQVNGSAKGSFTKGSPAFKKSKKDGKDLLKDSQNQSMFATMQVSKTNNEQLNTGTISSLRNKQKKNTTSSDLGNNNFL